MYTRCAGCNVVHLLNAELLAAAGGRYRCGICNTVNNALEALFDDWPPAGARAAGAGEIPVLGLPLDPEAAAWAARIAGSAYEGEPEPASGTTGRARRRFVVRSAWAAGAVLLLALVAWLLADLRSRPAPEPAGAGLERFRPSEPLPGQAHRDLGRVQLVSRELTSHPSQPGRLRLHATIVNRAEEEQPYPDIEVSLLDASGVVVLQRRFSPGNYLDPGRKPGSGMAPQAYLPLVLDMEDPGARAVGFELEFR